MKKPADIQWVSSFMVKESRIAVKTPIETSNGHYFE
jgi:hypothetical protein